MVDPDEKRQFMVLRHVLSWWKVDEKQYPALRVGLRLNTCYSREECLGRKA